MAHLVLTTIKIEKYEVQLKAYNPKIHNYMKVLITYNLESPL